MAQEVFLVSEINSFTKTFNCHVWEILNMQFWKRFDI